MVGVSRSESAWGQRFRLIGMKQHDVSCTRLGRTDLQAQPDTLDGVRVLPPFQRVPGPSPAEPPFFLSRTLRRDGEMLMPACRSISAKSPWRLARARSRGNVPFGRSSRVGAAAR